MSDMQTAGLAHRVKAFYERVSEERGAALGELPQLYSDDVHFMSPIANERGMASFLEAWNLALRKYKIFKFHDIEIVGTDDQFSLSYSMTIAFGVGPSFTVDMAAVCRARDGKVFYVRDYFDPLGSLVQPFGPLRWVYLKVFGVLVA